MRMEKVSGTHGWILKIAFLAAGASILVMFTAVNVIASNSGKPVRVTNVRFEVEHGEVLVTYDLFGQSDRTFRVSLELRKRGNPSYKYIPRAVRGDVGVGKFAGIDRRIVWSIDQEFPGGLPGSDYFFEVKAERIKPHSGIGFLTVVGTGVAVAAAAAAYFVLSNLGTHGTMPAALPAPPGRP